MFPLLDLDDDSIMVAFGYSDAATLSSITMTCQRLRRLADKSWTKVENVLSNSMKSTWTKNSKMGKTPRQRVLSATLIMHRWQWMQSISTIVETKDLSYLERNGYPIIPLENVSQSNYVLFVNISQRWWWHSKTHGFSSLYGGVSCLKDICTSSSFLSTDSPVNLAMRPKWVNDGRNNPIKHLLNCLYSGPAGTFTQRNISSGRPSNRALNAFKNSLAKKTDLSVIAIERNTLKPYILLKNHGGKFEAKTTATKLRNNSYRLEFGNDWVMNTENEKREVRFYVQNNSFGLRLYATKHED